MKGGLASGPSAAGIPARRAPAWARWLATWFRVGELAPFAPGTWGSLAALPVAAIGAVWPLAGLALAALIFALGVPAATRVAEERGDGDPGVVVVDEVVGMILAALGVGLDPVMLGLAFLLFRIFDIVKPFPCRRLEHLPGGWGIMLDDVMAGFYALAVLTLAGHLLTGIPGLSAFAGG